MDERVSLHYHKHTAPITAFTKNSTTMFSADSTGTIHARDIKVSGHLLLSRSYIIMPILFGPCRMNMFFGVPRRFRIQLLSHPLSGAMSNTLKQWVMNTS